MKNYTIAEVAEIFKRSQKTIYRWREEGIFQEVLQVKDRYLIFRKGNFACDRGKNTHNPYNSYT